MPTPDEIEHNEHRPTIRFYCFSGFVIRTMFLVLTILFLLLIFLGDSGIDFFLFDFFFFLWGLFLLLDRG